MGNYYFHTKGNNNYNDSPMATKSVGVPVTATMLQPTDIFLQAESRRVVFFAFS